MDRFYLGYYFINQSWIKAGQYYVKDRERHITYAPADTPEQAKENWLNGVVIPKNTERFADPIR